MKLSLSRSKLLPVVNLSVRQMPILGMPRMPATGIAQKCAFYYYEIQRQFSPLLCLHRLSLLLFIVFTGSNGTMSTVHFIFVIGMSCIDSYSLATELLSLVFQIMTFNLLLLKYPKLQSFCCILIVQALDLTMDLIVGCEVLSGKLPES